MLDNIECIVLDLDNTLVKGYMAEEIGKSLLLEEIEGFMKLNNESPTHLKTLLKGVIGYMKVKSVRDESEGLERFYKILGKFNVTKEKTYETAMKAIRKNELNGVKEFVDNLNGKYETIIVTMSDEMSAKAAKEYFDVDYSWGNPLVYKDDKIKGIELKIKDSKSKRDIVEKILEKRGFKLERCCVIGDGKNDHEIMKSAGYSMASPLADEETKRIADGGLETIRIIKSKPYNAPRDFHSF